MGTGGVFILRVLLCTEHVKLLGVYRHVPIIDCSFIQKCPLDVPLHVVPNMHVFVMVDQ